MDGDKKRVLVADDDRLIVEMLSDMLSDDFEVLKAHDGDQALSTLQKQRVDVVLCDHRMPGKTGVEVLRECASLVPQAVRFLITATDKVEDMRDAVNLAHVHRVVVKPVREVELRGLVKGALKQVELEAENKRLLKELKAAVAELQERERELERELQTRTDELKEVMDRVLRE